jgi:hypothetical protein
VSFRYFRQVDKLPDKASQSVFLNVITDQYFREANLALQQLPKNTIRETFEERHAHEQLEVAQSTSWALTYYLMNNHLDQVFAYSAELRKLPRDTDFDAPVLAGCFARAFGMPAPGRSVPIDTNLADDLATKWFNALGETALDIQGLETQLISERLDRDGRGAKKGAQETQNPGGNTPP